MELAEVLLALGADELEGVDAIALHVGPVGRDAIVVQQPRQLQARVTHSASAHPHMAPQDGAQHKGNWHHLHLCMLRPQRGCSNRQASLWQGWPGQHALGGDGWAPHNVDRLRVVGEEVQDAPALLDVGLGVGPQGVHQVHKLDPVPDEEHLHSAPRTARLRAPGRSDTSPMQCSLKRPAWQ